MAANEQKPSQSAKVMPGDKPPLRARDAELVIETGVDAGIDKQEPATARNALRGRMKIVQHERFHPIGWYIAIVVAIAALAVILGIQFF